MGGFYVSIMGSIGVFMALIALSLQHKHLLMILLSLEAMTMNLFIFILFASSNVMFSGEMSLMLITLGACEASLGLSVLVMIIRSQGNDYVSSFSSQKC